MTAAMKTLALLPLLLSLSAHAALTSRKVTYELDKTRFESVVLYDEAAGPRPGLLLVPNWLGINEANLAQARLIAERGYVVFVADVYGLKERPKNAEAAGKIAGSLKGDRPQLRARVRKALAEFLAQKSLPLDTKKVGAIGFCFGGTTALELARDGAEIAGVAAFHAGLSSPTPDDAKHIKGKVLALQGADDPSVPLDETAAFEKEMREAKVDWQLVHFGNTVHSFTDVDAKTPGRNQYNETSARRAYALMDSFFAEAFGTK